MMAMQWRDKKDVCLMSTVHNTSTAMVHTKGGKDVLKPQVVIDYSNTMGGVDRADQAMPFYPTMRKQQKNIIRRFSGIFWNNAFGILISCIEQRVTCLLFILTLSGRWLSRLSVAANRPGRRAVDIVNP